MANNLPILREDNSMFFDIQKFEHAQRVAKVFASSTMVPDHFRNNIGNTLIAMNYADRIGADLFMCMQAMCVIHGKPGIEGKLVIALLNNCGRFEPVEFKEIGNLRKPENSEHGCKAFAKDIRSGKTLEGPLVDWSMVKAEGWYDKNGSKWKTMAPLMFRYRAATYFARVYCPEVLLGMQTREELTDVYTLRKSGNTYTIQPDGGDGEDISTEPEQAKESAEFTTTKTEPIREHQQEKQPGADMSMYGGQDADTAKQTTPPPAPEPDPGNTSSKKFNQMLAEAYPGRIKEAQAWAQKYAEQHNYKYLDYCKEVEDPRYPGNWRMLKAFIDSKLAPQENTEPGPGEPPPSEPDPEPDLDPNKAEIKFRSMLVEKYAPNGAKAQGIANLYAKERGKSFLDLSKECVAFPQCFVELCDFIGKKFHEARMAADRENAQTEQKPPETEQKPPQTEQQTKEKDPGPDPAPNWWHTVSNWINRRGTPCLYMVRGGLGLPFVEQRVVRPKHGDAVTLDDPKAFEAEKAKNPEAVGTLLKAHPSTLDRVKDKIINGLGFEEGVWDRWMAEVKGEVAASQAEQDVHEDTKPDTIEEGFFDGVVKFNDVIISLPDDVNPPLDVATEWKRHVEKSPKIVAKVVAGMGMPQTPGAVLDRLEHIRNTVAAYQEKH